MKVALCFPGCHSRGGVERVVQASARYLASRGHDVHVFANEWDPDPDNNIHFHAVPMLHRPNFMRAPSFFKQCSKLLRPDEFDVVNIQGCECPPGHVFRIHSLHRAWIESSKRFRSPLSPQRIKQRLNPLHPLLLRLESRHLQSRQYKRLIALTPDVRRDLKNYYGVPETDVDVVPNGFNQTDFNPSARAARRESMRRQLGLREDQVAMLLVANELQRKGYPTILNAMHQMPPAQLKSLRLLVVGNVSEQEVKTLAHAAGVAEQVQFCGPTRDVASFHAASDLFILPTQYEAFCLAILEALASGLPVITTRVPGAYDAIQPGINGMLIEDPTNGSELAAAISSLLDSDHRAQLSAAAPLSVEAYRWPSVMERYEKVLLQQCA
jgi:UDP-glucose:(heptosyl)LPS alpha-1,3-glucosyltransferase